MGDVHALFDQVSPFIRVKRGESPDDFPDEHYEAHWPDRFGEEQLNRNGRRSLCLDN